MDVVNNISEKLVPKMLVPFRKGKNRDKVEDIIHDEIASMVQKHNKMHDKLAKEKEQVDKTLTETREMLKSANGIKGSLKADLKEMKRTHIPAPNTGIGNRFRFLFTGKLK